jgi:hypothetical protein
VSPAQAAEDGDDALGDFGKLESGEDVRKNQTMLGQKLIKFKGRWLGGIRMLADISGANHSRHRFRFLGDTGPKTPPPQSPSSAPSPQDVNLVNLVNLPRSSRGGESVTKEKNTV